MDDAHEDRFRQHEAIMAGLARMLEAQHDFNRQQLVLNQQQREINADVRTTLARIETLLTRMLHTGENGQEA
jgi:hypothetical protein